MEYGLRPPAQRALWLGEISECGVRNIKQRKKEASVFIADGNLFRLRKGRGVRSDTIGQILVDVY